MPKQRSMNDALSPAALTFLKGDEVQSGDEKETRKERKTDGITPTEKEASYPQDRGEKQNHPPKPPKRATPQKEPLTQLSIKIPESLHRELIMIATKRKLDMAQPYTQQSIVAEALRQWLSKNS